MTDRDCALNEKTGITVRMKFSGNSNSYDEDTERQQFLRCVDRVFSSLCESPFTGDFSIVKVLQDTPSEQI